MKELLYWVVEKISVIHDYILTINDSYEYALSDKELHFLIMAVIGMLLIFIIYPIFKALSKRHVMVIAWIYVFTVMIVLTFAIEIGQKITNTGNMELADIVFGIMGFLIAFFIFSLIRGLYHLIIKLIKEYKEKREIKDENEV